MNKRQRRVLTENLFTCATVFMDIGAELALDGQSPRLSTTTAKRLATDLDGLATGFSYLMKATAAVIHADGRIDQNRKSRASKAMN